MRLEDAPVPKTDADVDSLVYQTLVFCADNGLTDLRGYGENLEKQIREAVEMARRSKSPYFRPFTDEEMRNRW